MFNQSQSFSAWFLSTCGKQIRRAALVPAVLVSVLAPLGLFAFAVTGPVTGQAVIYSDSMNGKTLALKGSKYDKDALTAATHSTFPMGSSLKVTNLANNKSVIVKINDRMNPKSKAVIDLSKKAAEELDMVRAGHVQVKVEMEGK